MGVFPIPKELTENLARFPQMCEDIAELKTLLARLVELHEGENESVFRSSGQTKQYASRPRIATARPRAQT